MAKLIWDEAYCGGKVKILWYDSKPTQHEIRQACSLPMDYDNIGEETPNPISQMAGLVRIECHLTKSDRRAQTD